MEKILKFWRAFTFYRFSSYLSLVAVGIAVSISCSRKSESFYILDLDIEDEVSDFSKTQQFYSSVPDNNNSTSIVAEQGDVLILSDEFYFHLRQVNTGKMKFRTEDNIAYLNDKICSVYIPSNEKMIPWFEGVKDYDLSSLNFLDFASDISDGYLPYLEETGKIAPDIGLCFADLKGNAKMVMSYFRPRVIICQEVNNEDLPLLSDLPQLEVLAISFGDTVNDPLPSMPGLKELSVLNIDKSMIVTPDLLSNNRQIERIIIYSEEFDLSLLKPLKGLRNLIVSCADSLENYELLKDFKSVEVFKPGWEGFRYDMVPGAMSELRWVSFNTDASQDEFDKFIESHPDLEVVELINNSDISDLQALKNLMNLSVLSVGDTLTDLKTLLQLRNLKLTLLPGNVLNDSTIKAELQNSLPNTRLAEQNGVCLGSGWLLLLIPLIMLISLSYRSKRRKASQNG